MSSPPFGSGRSSVFGIMQQIHLSLLLWLILVVIVLLLYKMGEMIAVDYQQTDATAVAKAPR